MMMRNVVAGLTLVALSALPALPAHAVQFGAEHVSTEPSATLLLPYFQVALPRKPGGKLAGVDTLFSIANASATAILARVTLWSDLAVPVFGFNVYLTGFDVQTIDMLDILNGKQPITASDGQDPFDTVSPTDGISNQGIISQDINFASCTGQLPPPSELAPEFIEHLRNALTGKFSPLAGGCLGRDYGEKKPIARGFVTVDTVNSCTSSLPDFSYFSSVVTFQNVIWGDYIYLNRSKKIAHGEPLVNVRTDFTDSEVATAGQYTFYARLVASTAIDHRQPLGAKFASRYVNVPKDKLFRDGTSLIVWRDPKRVQNVFSCGASPTWFPLGQEQIVIFDEQENPEVPPLITPFPAATQIVKLGGPAFPIAANSGWVYLNLNTTVTGSSIPTEDTAAAQSWVTTVFEGRSKSSVGFRAIMVESAAATSHSLLPVD